MTVAIFEYKCPNCGWRDTSTERGDRLNRVCRGCGWRILHRVFGIRTERPMPEHFNGTVNRYISSNQQFDRELRRASEEASVYANQEVRYERVDGEDTRSLGVTAEGLDSTNRIRAARGLRTINTDAL